MCPERLVESLRLPQVPILHAQVFLFFRVLLLRMSPQHLTSLWPTMITELVSTRRCTEPCSSVPVLVFNSSHTYSCMLLSQVQVFLLMEQELMADEDITRCTAVWLAAVNSLLTVLFSFMYFFYFLTRSPSGRQGRRSLAWRPPTQEETASPPPTTASAGSTSTSLHASSWIWPWPCLLRACLSSRCQCR